MNELLEQIAELEKKDIATRDKEFQTLQSEYFANTTIEAKNKLYVYFGSAVKSAILKKWVKSGIHFTDEDLYEKIVDGIIKYLHYTIDKGVPVLAKLSGYAEFIAREVLYNRNDVMFDQAEELPEELEHNEEERTFQISDGKYIVINGNSMLVDGFLFTISDSGYVSLVADDNEHNIGFDDILKSLYFFCKLKGIEYLLIDNIERGKSYEWAINRAKKLKYVVDWYMVDDNTVAVRVRK